LAEPRIDGLAAARLWAATRFPYLATGVFGAQVTPDPGSGTVCVDENWRMRADPDLAAAWTPAELGSVLVHHVCHLLRMHGERAQAAGVVAADARAWIRAADAEINDDLVPAGLDLPGRPVVPYDLGAQDGLLAEQYFEYTRGGEARGGAEGKTQDRSASGEARGGAEGRTPDRSASGEARGGAEGKTQARSVSSEIGGTAGSWLDCGSGADGVPRPGDGAGGLPDWQAELLRRQVAQDVIAHGQEPGAVPAGLLRWAQEVLHPKVDWRRLLAAELRRAVAQVSGAVDYSYRRPSRRSSVAGDVVLPALRRPVPEVAVVCDTSGSMTADLLAMVLAEVEGLLRALGLARQVRVLACDTAVAAAQRVTSARQVQLTGGGGTDMGAGIAAAAALRPRPAITVVLTDGYTPWPADAPKGTRVVVGLLGAHAPDAPRWSRSVRIEPG
jgi:predicted metal-dependent peptidase